MQYSSAKVQIDIGNMLSTVSGDVPSGMLEEVFNHHLPSISRFAGSWRDSAHPGSPGWSSPTDASISSIGVTWSTWTGPGGWATC